MATPKQSSIFKYFGSNKSESATESKSTDDQAKRRKESQQQYEQKRKRSFQRKWLEEFDGMDITKYRPGQNKYTTLMQNKKWST